MLGARSRRWTSPHVLPGSVEPPIPSPCPGSSFDGESGFDPAAVASIHGHYVAVAHFHEAFGGDCRAEASAAIEHDLGCLVGNRGLDVALDHALADVHGAFSGHHAFVVLAHVNKMEALALFDQGQDLGDRGFLDLLLRC
jgi:hypothetical protein